MCELLERAREAQGNISYWEVAKRLKVSDQVMNKWKNNKSLPNGVNALKLADMARVKPAEAVKLLESGFVSLSLLIVTAMLGIALYCSVHYADSLYIMLNRIYKMTKYRQVKKAIFGHADRRRFSSACLA